MKRRIVITGMGVISPIAIGKENWPTMRIILLIRQRGDLRNPASIRTNSPNGATCIRRVNNDVTASPASTARG